MHRLRFLIADFRLHTFLLGVFAASVLLTVFGQKVGLFLLIAIVIYFFTTVIIHVKKKKIAPPALSIKPTKEHKALMKLKKNRLIEAEKKHEMIHNQFAYIQEAWSLNASQQKIFVDFIEKRAYSDLYTKMTISILPQLIKLIDKCLEENLPSCKREVTRRINELTAVMKGEIKRKKEAKIEDFETISHVYDRLIAELT